MPYDKPPKFKPNQKWVTKQGNWITITKIEYNNVWFNELYNNRPITAGFNYADCITRWINQTEAQLFIGSAGIWKDLNEI